MIYEVAIMFLSFTLAFGRLLGGQNTYNNKHLHCLFVTTHPLFVVYVQETVLSYMFSNLGQQRIVRHSELTRIGSIIKGSFSILLQSPLRKATTAVAKPLPHPLYFFHNKKRRRKPSSVTDSPRFFKG